MSEPPEKPAGKPMPISEWLTLMLGEIERKDAEARAAEEERERRDRRDQGERPASGCGSTDVT